MYTAHFGLREMPFSITPDPSYLYLSPHHQEALGHLLYGTGQYGGFVQLTGEVGTGKTTIVRTLLAQKLDDVDVAVVLNPRQNEHEFVASICDELGVKYPTGATLKTLVDALNAHLLDAHARGRRTVVIIDEAQNLQPEVLEQVRLLTNLETHKEKLLRIMLVGQPELTALLARPDLRQLAQRITARYHLTPLAADETAQYVAHRLHVAGGRGDLFTAQAVDAVHRLSRGVPRVVNILCDRALLGAYAAGAQQVTAELVERAAREVQGVAPPVAARQLSWVDVAVVLGIVVVGTWWFWRSQAPVPAAATAAAEAVPAESPALPPTPPPPAPPATLDQLLRAAQPLPLVLSRLLEVWGVRPQVGFGETVCDALARERMGCYKSTGEWRELRQLDRPAILALNSGKGGLQHVLLRELGSDDALIETATGGMRLPLAQIDLLWTGEFLMLWRRATDDAFIDARARPASVAWLREALARSENRAPPTPLSGAWDDGLRQQLLRFQAAQGLDADGIAGPRTLIMLANLQPMTGVPTLAAGGAR